MAATNSECTKTPTNSECTKTPTLKYHYFPFEGPRGGSITYALFHGDIQFEDERVAPQNWPEKRDSYPLKSLPVLEVNGKTYTQSNAILKFVGRLTGLYPKECPGHQLQVDEVLDILEEIIAGFAAPMFKKMKAQQDFSAEKATLVEHFPKFLAGFETLLTRNGASPYVTGNKITVADIKLSLTLPVVASRIEAPELIANYPHVKAVIDAVTSDEKFKAWLAKYPQQTPAAAAH